MHCVYIVKKLKKQPLPTRIICKQDLISNGQDRGGACGVVNAVSATLRGDDGRRNVESSRRSCGFYSAHDTSAESTCSLSLMQTYGAVLLSSAGLGFIMERALTAAARGVPKRSGGAVNMITTRLLFLFILPSLSLCAPQAQKTLSDDTLAPDLANPFGSSEENRRLLQNYIKSSLKEGQTNPELNTREQEVFFLFSLYDYDRSGQMDGLELMQLLTDFLTYHEIMPKSTDSVVSLVDYLLQAQDLNQDGLLAPSELLSSSTIDHQQENNIVPPDPPADEALNQEQTHTTSEDGDPETHQQDAEVKLESEHENEMPEKFEEQHDQLQDDHQEQTNMPVHQEQPEM